MRKCLQPAWTGLLLAILTLLLGQALGIVFGLNEDLIKSRLKAQAESVSTSVYADDQAAMVAVQEKAWRYMLRAHLHAGSMGTTALSLTVLVALLGLSRRQTMVLSLGLGGGSLGYSLFWLLAGCAAPALGSTSAAKESLRWLAMPSSGAFVLATSAVMVFLVKHLHSSATGERE